LEYMDLVRKRRSIRRYKPDPIPEQYLKTILEAARLAPSSDNRQCWRYIIVTEQDIKQRVAEAGKNGLVRRPL
jgi:nitroreductase